MNARQPQLTGSAGRLMRDCRFGEDALSGGVGSYLKHHEILDNGNK